jgi:hypothetical protein
MTKEDIKNFVEDEVVPAITGENSTDKFCVIYDQNTDSLALRFIEINHYMDLYKLKPGEYVVLCPKYDFRDKYVVRSLFDITNYVDYFLMLRDSDNEHRLYKCDVANVCKHQLGLNPKQISAVIKVLTGDAYVEGKKHKKWDGSYDVDDYDSVYESRDDDTFDVAYDICELISNNRIANERYKEYVCKTISEPIEKNLELLKTFGVI